MLFRSLLDEVQECLPDIDGITAQRMAKQLAALIDQCHVPLVLFGTPMASRLLHLRYGMAKNRVYGEEQLSRRFLAEQRLLPVPQRCQAWLNCVNYFCDKHVFQRYSLHDKRMLNRLYLATHGKPGLLEKLFAFLPVTQTTVNAEDFFKAFDLTINNVANNPFDEVLFSDEDVLCILDAWRQQCHSLLPQTSFPMKA